MRIRPFIREFYAHPTIRKTIGLLRYRFFSISKGFRTISTENARENTISHNLTAFEHIDVDFSMPRMGWLLRALTAIETVGGSSKVLIIGPRTESDILTLKGLGISDVRGLDLISYSPYVDLGDMHRMPYNDDHFDAVVCGWTLSYSVRPQDAVNEMIRVAKDKGVLAFGVEHLPPDSSIALNTDTRLINPSDDKGRINSCEDIESLIGEKIGEVCFRHNAPLRNMSPTEIIKMTGLASSQVMLVASIKKGYDSQPERGESSGCFLSI